MANTKKKTKRIARRGKLHLKKSARWTIAGLMMVTAIIIALIPVQNGGVSAMSTDTVPSVADLCDDSKHGIVDKKIADPSATSKDYTYAFPLVPGQEGILSIKNGQEVYHLINMNGMPNSETLPIPIFRLSQKDGSYNYLSKYTGSGDSTYEPPGGSIDLGSDVCVNLSDRHFGTQEDSSPRYITVYSDDPKIQNKEKPGTYQQITEELVEHTDSAQGITYKYFHVVVEEWEVVGVYEGETEPKVFKPDPTTPNLLSKEEYYAVKDTSTTSNDAIKNVAHICDEAFKGCGDITAITLPNNITEIGVSAFEECSGLTNVEIGDRCTSIGDRAFMGCTKLERFGIKDDKYGATNLSFIGDCAFAGCEKLESFIVPNKSNMTIGSGAFINTGLSNIDFATYSSPTITLGCYCLANNDNLVDVNLENVGIVGKNQKDATHKSADVAGCGIFTNCKNLSTVVFDNEFQSELGYGTFAGCNNLYNVKFKNGNATFHYIENDATTPHTFESDFKGLNNNFHIWGDGADDALHRECTKCSITYRYHLEEPDDKNFEYFDKYGYRYDFSPLDDGTYIIKNISDKNVVYTAADKSNELLDIPYSICDFYNISQIGDNACAGLTQKKVKQINIPDSINAIGDQAFADIPSLERVMFTHNRSNVDGRDIPQAESLKLGADVFYKDNNLDDIYLRHYEYESDGTVKNVFDPNIVEIGTSTKNGKTVGAFYTENANGTTIHGAMYDRLSATKEPYYAFTYCMNEDTGKCNNKLDGFVYYMTDGPELLEAKYTKRTDGTAGASLLSYPTKDSEIITGVEVDEYGQPIPDPSTGLYKFTKTTLEDMVQNLDSSKPDYNFDARDAFEEIYVPKGISTIEDLIVTYPSGDGDPTKAEVVRYFQNLKPIYKDGAEVSSTKRIVFGDIKKLPDEAFASKLNPKDPSQVTLNDIVPSTLNMVTFENDLWDIGKKPFLNSKNVRSVMFSPNENASTDTASIDAGDKSYRYDGNGMIYCTEYDDRYNPAHEDNTLVCFLPGFTTSAAIPSDDINRIDPSAFENCDSVYAIDLSMCTNLREEYTLDASGKKKIIVPVIPQNFAYDADSLGTVILPESVTSIGEHAFTPEENHEGSCLEDVITVTIPCYDTLIDEEAFQWNTLATLRGYPDSAAQRHADADHPTHDSINNIKFESLGMAYYATFVDDKGNIIGTPERVMDGGYVQVVPTITPPAGFKFVEWRASGGKKVTDAVHSDLIFVPIFEPEETSSSSGSSSSPSSSGSSSSSSSKSSSSSSSTNKSSSSTSGSGSSSSTNNRPVVISGAPTPVVQPGTGAGAPTGTATAGSATGSNVATANTNVVSTAPGLTNNGKMSATVNGSSNNYIIKLTETPEADQCAEQALSGAFGSMENIRYMPFDISLYDATGTQKISPVPAGVTVSVTMPIPDDLAVYGGNNKIASTVGGVLETIQPRFTVIDGVPCMNYTVSHLSPYVVYVDTANLTASGTLDATPKTGDPIHPKWFLCIGLAAISIFLFLKRDKDTLRAA